VRNLSTDVRRTLTAPVRMDSGGRSHKISTQEATLMVLRERALNGDARALDRLIELAMRFNNQPSEIGTQPLASEDEAILAAYEQEIRAAVEEENRTALPTRQPAEGPRNERRRKKADGSENIPLGLFVAELLRKKSSEDSSQ
jgi:hypothetical protein